MYFTTTSETSAIEPHSAVETVNTGLVFSSSLPGQQSLAWQIDAILTSTDSSGGMKAVKRIFNDLVRLLECLRLMEANLHQIRETVALLELIRLDTIALRLHRE